MDNDSVAIELPSGIIYLRISQFQQTTGKELEENLTKL